MTQYKTCNCKARIDLLDPSTKNLEHQIMESQASHSKSGELFGELISSPSFAGPVVELDEEDSAYSDDEDEPDIDIEELKRLQEAEEAMFEKMGSASSVKSPGSAKSQEDAENAGMLSLCPVFSLINTDYK
jgi:hypothetical protein